MLVRGKMDATGSGWARLGNSTRMLKQIPTAAPTFPGNGICGRAVRVFIPYAQGVPCCQSSVVLGLRTDCVGMPSC